eukprot:15477902-Alexandrium_andersonii.AAC.1
MGQSNRTIAGPFGKLCLLAPHPARGGRYHGSLNGPDGLFTTSASPTVVVKRQPTAPLTQLGRANPHGAAPVAQSPTSHD